MHCALCAQSRYVRPTHRRVTLGRAQQVDALRMRAAKQRTLAVRRRLSATLLFGAHCAARIQIVPNRTVNNGRCISPKVWHCAAFLCALCRFSARTVPQLCTELVLRAFCATSKAPKVGATRKRVVPLDSILSAPLHSPFHFLF